MCHLITDKGIYCQRNKSFLIFFIKPIEFLEKKHIIEYIGFRTYINTSCMEFGGNYV